MSKVMKSTKKVKAPINSGLKLKGAKADSNTVTSRTKSKNT